MHRAMANDEAERAVLGCALLDAESHHRVLPLLQAHRTSPPTRTAAFFT